MRRSEAVSAILSRRTPVRRPLAVVFKIIFQAIQCMPPLEAVCKIARSQVLQLWVVATRILPMHTGPWLEEPEIQTHRFMAQLAVAKIILSTVQRVPLAEVNSIQWSVWRVQFP